MRHSWTTFIFIINIFIVTSPYISFHLMSIMPQRNSDGLLVHSQWLWLRIVLMMTMAVDGVNWYGIPCLFILSCIKLKWLFILYLFLFTQFASVFVTLCTHRSKSIADSEFPANFQQISSEFPQKLPFKHFFIRTE